ncbi:hypothetical protein MA16_Dca018153 [Dendrobium catenatum]|uniref:Uncharacterized protein n=1 Tax=Dendrobium catenatum TaxID=906689 RepID=A0A2I0VSS2_9ASPA|nr:hypothetical protein MA16_Dca018153 [Dendrobium catenatum]
MAVETEVAGNANAKGFESVAILSSDAQPFTPTGLNLISKHGCHSVEGPSREVPLLSVVSAPAILASQSLNSGDLVVSVQSHAMDNLDKEVCRVAVSGNSSPIRNERVVLNDFVDVPVTYMDPKSLHYNVKDKSGVDLRVHLDWLHDYSSVSESESGSDSVESLGDGDPGNSFNLLRDKPLCGSFASLVCNGGWWVGRFNWFVLDDEEAARLQASWTARVGWQPGWPFDFVFYQWMAPPWQPDAGLSPLISTFIILISSLIAIF